MVSTRASQRRGSTRSQSSISTSNINRKQRIITANKKQGKKSVISNKKKKTSRNKQTGDTSHSPSHPSTRTQTQVEKSKPTNSNPDSDSDSSDSESSDSDSNSDTRIGFTLENFGSHLPSWSVNELRRTLQKKKNPSNRLPVDVQEALQLLQQNYLKSKLMLALIGNVGEKTVNKFLGENKPSRKQCGWNRYVAFSLESLKHPVPPKGTSEGWDQRNCEMGKAWASLTADEKEVFSSRVFQHFSKIPCGYDKDDDDYVEDEDSELEGDEGRGLLTPDEISLYMPLYNNLVNHDKVKAFIAKGPESEGHNAGQAYKQALKNIMNLNSELYTVSNAYNTTYYLLSATRTPGLNSFCKEYSNDAAWLALAQKEWNSKETFEAYSHGRQIQANLEAITNGPEGESGRDADKLKKNLRNALNDLLAAARGSKKAIFPKGPNPVALLLESDPELQVVRAEGSRLSQESLLLGFDKMKKIPRQKWLADIASGHFTIEKNSD
ncbi:hypothetical protein PGT21_019637 [Puccinia graminis f. sp. tritici]|uniref:Uncharacterized protein n=1 Tax=Puccinia graminis f. sp. tritici TaxID=56615 RepID=A0A5B0RG53_PUCGR|nr:hypothetical protein PGT21_019637 [Puccinia graminis f. sp. tritici]KAA1124168.1 hypothetical protein PGTUg99_030920 [Puccinia graminis f. sp. tritici]